MIIKDTIDQMLQSLPANIPDLLQPDQAEVVLLCLLKLKELARKKTWNLRMSWVSAVTTLGVRNMRDYVELADCDSCMSSTAKDLSEYRRALWLLG